MTPLHKAFETNSYTIICKCLISSNNPDLNALNKEGKTPLAYCSRKILEKLNLETGVVRVDSVSTSVRFDNNRLLYHDQMDQVIEDEN